MTNRLSDWALTFAALTVVSIKPTKLQCSIEKRYAVHSDVKTEITYVTIKG